MPDVPPVAGERTWTIHWCPRCECRSSGPLHFCKKGPPLFPQEDEWTTCEKVEVLELSRLRAAEEERDRARRLFNRLDAAISHHRKGKDGTGRAFADDADDALHAAHDRILKEAAGG